MEFSSDLALKDVSKMFNIYIKQYIVCLIYKICCRGLAKPYYIGRWSCRSYEHEMSWNSDMCRELKKKNFFFTDISHEPPMWNISLTDEYNFIQDYQGSAFMSDKQHSW